MAEQDQSSKVPIAGLLVLVAAIAGTLVWNRVPLDAGRPAREKTEQHRREVLQDINARLWEDPLAVLWRHKHRARSAQAAGEKSAKEAPKRTRTVAGICEDLAAGSDGTLDLLLLGVMISNSRYLDASENRSRTRYALQAALSVAHFVPLDAQHIGFFVPDPGQRKGSELSVPFEVYQRKIGQRTDAPSTHGQKASRDRKVLVFWIEEEVLAQPSGGPAAPLSNIAAMIQKISNACADRPRNHISVETAIIGPANSDTLRAMVHEVDGKPPWFQPECKPMGENGSKHCREADSIRQLHFYSAFATASGSDLLQLQEDTPYKPCGIDHWLPPNWDSKDGRGTGSVLHDYFHGCGIELFSTVATDEELSIALVAELGRRGLQGLAPDASARGGRDGAGAKPAAPDYYIVLVSEADTYYGRMLPKAFLRSIGMEHPCEDDPMEVVDSGPCRVLRYSYLRGLDGQVPPADDTNDGTKDDKQKESPAQADRAAAALERGEGPRQFDYLRRLSQRIGDESRRLLDGGAPRDKIRAIGVLGTDVYDKIAVLRALRKDFPHAVFFTTDLDARLLDSDQYDWTRNLVVASSFGLELAPCIQKWVPPFRGTYQTSAYFSARLALYNAFADDAEPTAAVLCQEYAPDETIPGRLPPLAGLPRGSSVVGSSARAQCPQRAAWVPRVTQADIDSWLAGPRLYEIGRQHAWDLSEKPSASESNAVSVQPAVHPLVPSSARLLIGISLAMLVLLGSLLLRPVRHTFLDAAYCLGFRHEPGQPGQHTQQSVCAARATLAVFLALVAIVGVYLVLAYCEAAKGTGEPVLWFQGISAWPSELLRCLALLLVALLLFAACGKTKRNAASVASHFRLEHGREQHLSWRLVLGWLSAPSRPRAPGEPRDRDEPRTLSVQSFWNDYAAATSPGCCIRRAILWTAVFSGLAVIIMYFWGYPGAPVRGPVARSFNFVLMFSVFLGYLLVLFFVADLTRLSDRFCDTVSDPDVERSWPPELIEEYSRDLIAVGGPANTAAGRQARETKARLRERVVDAWLVARIVAERTSAITPLIYFPFLLLALIVMSRWHVFDNWDMPIGLLVVYLASLGVACFSAWSLQRTGARVRTRCIVQLERCLLARKGDSEEWRPTVEQIEQLIKRVRKLKQGAFVPFVEQPLVRAVLLPFAGAGGLEAVGMLGLIP